MVENLKKIFGNKLKQLGEIADVICGPFGSTIKNNDYQEDGIPLIRITNITKDGYMNYDDLVYISEKLSDSLSRTQVKQGDIVISQRGSLGQCAIIDDKFEKLNISANIIAVKNITEVSAEFFHNYFLSFIGQALLERNISGQVQQKITTQDISELLIPTGCNEEMLNSFIRNAYSTYEVKLRQANELVENSKEKMLSSIGIKFSAYKPSLFGFQKLKEIQDYGIYCNSHSSYLSYILRILNSKSNSVELSEYIEVNPITPREDLSDNSLVSFVPMAAVEEFCNSATYTQVPYCEVKTGFTIFKRGDLIWAKITPCMQNGKSFIATEMPTEIGFGSTEFHVLRIKEGYENKVYMPFIWVFLSETHILDAAQGMFSGSAGQQRVSSVFLKKFPLVLPEYKIQKKLADAVIKAIKKASQLKNEAQNEWNATRKQFEQKLLDEGG